jgi:hypothetical protein
MESWRPRKLHHKDFRIIHEGLLSNACFRIGPWPTDADRFKVYTFPDIPNGCRACTLTNAAKILRRCSSI